MAVFLPIISFFKLLVHVYSQCEKQSSLPASWLLGYFVPLFTEDPASWRFCEEAVWLSMPISIQSQITVDWKSVDSCCIECLMPPFDTSSPFLMDEQIDYKEHYINAIWPNVHRPTLLRLLDTFSSKIAKICNFWTFRLVIKLIEQLLKIRQKAFLHNGPFCRILKRRFISWIKGQDVLRSQIFVIFEA